MDLGGKALGITIDPKRAVLYAGSRDRKKLLAVDPVDPPGGDRAGRRRAHHQRGDAGRGRRRLLHRSEQRPGVPGHRRRREVPGHHPTRSRTPTASPSGPTDACTCSPTSKAKITRLVLKAGKEASRELVAELIAGGKNADGITFDKQGRLYVTAGALYRVSPDGKKVESLGAAYGANADFGSGALGCADLYTAGNGKGITRFQNDTDGPGRALAPSQDPKLAEKVSPPAPPKPVPAKLAAKAKLDVADQHGRRAGRDRGGAGRAGGPHVRRRAKQGPIRILRGKTFEPKPFLDITGKVVAVEEAEQRAGPAGPGLPPAVPEERPRSSSTTPTSKWQHPGGRIPRRQGRPRPG